MGEYFVVALAGFLACMVDGSLGMGFGPTSSTILLGTGLPPVTVSATVNLAKVMTGIAGGVSHWRFGNVDRRLVWRLVVPGVVGAFLGGTALRNVSNAVLEPALSVLLILVAVRILVRFSRAVNHDGVSATDVDMRGVGAAGLAGGVTNGLIGAWGPVVTPVLIHKGLQTRFAVGSVNAAEVAVAAVSFGSLVPAIRNGGIDSGILVSMIVGGVIAAPLAAALVRRLPRREMALAVAGLLMVTNIRILAKWADLDWTRWLAYAAAILVVAIAWSKGRASTP